MRVCLRAYRENKTNRKKTEEKEMYKQDERNQKDIYV